VKYLKIQENEIKRRKEMHENLTATHMFCFFIMIFALALNNKLFSLSNYNLTSIRFLIFFAAGLIGIAIINIYNLKNASLESSPHFTWIDFLYVSIPMILAAFTLFEIGRNTFNIEVILLLPVIIASSLKGKNVGMASAATGMTLIYFENIIGGGPNNFFSILQDNLILISVMFIVAWFIGAQTDLDNRYRLRLTKLAHTDLLTGLYNYGYFREKINDYIQNASEKHPVSLIMFDIDYFKHYNDIHGHQAGDLLIKVIGDILNTKVTTGFASRYGGDEFVIVLPDTDSTEALKLAEDISKLISSRGFHGEEYQPAGKITISCGIAVCPTHARTAKDLVKHADEALYRAKSLDKNKIEMYFSVFDNLDVEDNEKELLNSIRTLVSVINAKDRYTFGHSERVTENSLKLAARLGLAQEEINLLGYAAFLHDIGKIELDHEILNKAEPLNEKEYEMIKHHPEWGSEIVKAIKKLHPIVPVIRHHHENFDGSGYPDALKGKEIPLLARIIRLTDSYDAMISHRPYKERLTITAALEEIRANIGTQFDPELATLFLEIIQEEGSR